MTQFHRENIEGPWVSLAQQYPHIYLDPSPNVHEIWNEYKGRGDTPKDKKDLCNLRYGFEMPDEAFPLVKQFTEEIDALMKKAKDNGHDFHYWSFILKTKFGTIRDQGDIGGVDAHLYRKEYYDISHKLYERSEKCEFLHPRKKRKEPQ